MTDNHLTDVLPQVKTCNENRFFSVKKNYTGKTLFSLQGWVCSAVTFHCKTYNTLILILQICKKTQNRVHPYSLRIADSSNAISTCALI
jgi:hypothetical protein